MPLRPALLFHQLPSVPRQVAQLALGPRENEAGLQQPVLQELCNPLTVADVALASRHLLQMPRVHQQHRVTAFQDVEDRLPKDSGRFHRHMGDTLGGHPVGHRPKAPWHGAPRPRWVAKADVGFQSSHVRFDCFFMGVRSGTTRNNGFHDPFLSLRRRSRNVTICSACSPTSRRQPFGVRSAVLARLCCELSAPSFDGLRSTQAKSVLRRSRQHFHPSGCRKMT